MKTTRFFGFINGIGFSPVGKRDADAFVRKGSRYGSPITFTGYRSFYIIDEAISNPSSSSIVKQTNETSIETRVILQSLQNVPVTNVLRIDGYKFRNDFVQIFYHFLSSPLSSPYIYKIGYIYICVNFNSFARSSIKIDCIVALLFQPQFNDQFFPNYLSAFNLFPFLPKYRFHLSANRISRILTRTSVRSVHQLSSSIERVERNELFQSSLINRTSGLNIHPRSRFPAIFPNYRITWRLRGGASDKVDASKWKSKSKCRRVREANWKFLRSQFALRDLSPSMHGISWKFLQGRAWRCASGERERETPPPSSTRPPFHHVCCAPKTSRSILRPPDNFSPRSRQTSRKRRQRVSRGRFRESGITF